MDKGKQSGVMVYIQQQETLLPVGLELLAEGGRLARLLNQPLYAAVVHAHPQDAIQALSAYALDTVYTFGSAVLTDYTVTAYTDAMEQIVRRACPSILLFGATAQGRDLAARLAARLHTGLTADCTSLEIDAESGQLLQVRPAYGGNVMATIIGKENTIQMATVRPGVFTAAVPAAGGKRPQLIALSAEIRSDETSFTGTCAPASVRRFNEIQVLSKMVLPAGSNPLTGAKCIVAAGRGVRNQTGASLVSALARALGGMVACSRAAVEEGLFPKALQVGQTGQTVRPQVYIACGVSGAVQHIAGMNGAKSIVAINSDPAAPIFQYADYGICADLFEVLPQLIRLVSDAGASSPKR